MQLCCDYRRDHPVPLNLDPLHLSWLTWRLLCSSFLGSILYSLLLSKQVMTKNCCIEVSRYKYTCVYIYIDICVKHVVIGILVK